MKFKFSIAFFLLWGQFIFSQEIKNISDTCTASFRGLSVVNDSLVWVSGTRGTVGISENGGKKWNWIKVKNHTTLDFRSIYAFDEKRVLIANAGFPATILITEDGGENWTQVFRTYDSSMFFDGVDFWDKNNGIIFGDPVKGKMYIAKTSDGGKTWKEIANENKPALQQGEAAFAASGTTIRVFPKGKVVIATGGAISRIWYSENSGVDWKFFNTPVLQGKSSQGIFSFAVSGTKMIIAGGDYSVDTLRANTICTGRFPGKKFRPLKVQTVGYCSAVEFITPTTAIVTGTPGSAISFDSGNTWKAFSKTSYNCVRKARNGSAVYFCGGKGQIGKLSD